VPLVNIMLSEVIFGGVGSGMYGILVYNVLAVFIAGLMLGRTPEYLGKKIEAYDVKMAMLVSLLFPLVTLQPFAIFSQAPRRCSSSCRFWSASFRRRLAVYSKLLASRAWTDWCSIMSWPCRDEPLRRRGM